MKKLAMLLMCILTAGIASAVNVVLEDDFSSYTGGTIYGDDWKPKWDSNTNNVPLQQDLLTATNGIATLDTSKAFQNYHCPIAHGFSMTGDDEYVIKTDMRFVHAPGGAPAIKNKPFFALMVDTTPNWWDGSQKYKGVAMRNKAIGLTHDGTGGLWVEGWVNTTDLGVNATVGGTSDWMVVQADLSVSNSTIWMDVNVLDAGDLSVLIDGTPLDTGIAEGTTIYAGLTTGYNGATTNTIEEITQVSSVDIDNFYAGTPPLDTIVWQDDFNDLADEASVQNRGNWELVNNNNKWMGYNGYAMQRPGFSTNKTGSGWGGVMNNTAMAPAVGETAIVEFDWRAFTGEANNNAMLDIAMMSETWTNGVWGDRPQSYYDYANSAMGFRFYQKAGGGWRIYYAETTNVITVLDFDDAVLGIDPVAGDHTGDTVRVTYSIERTTRDDTLFVGLSIYNAASNTTLTIPDIKVENSTLYNQPNFYFMSAGFNNYAVGTEGNEYDNFEGIIRAQDPDNVLPEGVIIDEDFNGMADNAMLDDDREWDPLNATGDHFEITNGTAVCWPSEDLGLNYRGEMNTFSTITNLAVGDTVEISFDEKLYCRNVDNSVMLDVILSSVYTNASTAYNDEDAVGLRVSKRATGDFRIDNYAGNPGADQLNTSLTNLGAVAVSGATTTEWHRVTYSLVKSATPNIWTVDVTVSNMVSGWSDTLSGVDVVQTNTYNAGELFFGFYGASNYGNTNGVAVDNLLVKVIPSAETDPYNIWAGLNGVTGDKGADDDGDGLNNFGEWVFGGDPNVATGADDQGVLPTLAAGQYNFSVMGDSTLTVNVLTNIDLVNGSWGLHEAVPISDSGTVDPYTSMIGDSADQVFIKLYVSE